VGQKENIFSAYQIVAEMGIVRTMGEVCSLKTISIYALQLHKFLVLTTETEDLCEIGWLNF
jgi:hypothetical protein